MLDSLKKIPSYFLKILCLGCLLVLLAAPLLAQDQTPKDQGTPQTTTPPTPAAQPKKAPQQPVHKEFKLEKPMPRTMGGQEYQMKGVDDTIGGQEIRNKKGPEDIK
jgi:hypothetical protein